MAEIRIPTPLRKFSDDQASVQVAAGNIRQAIDELVKQYPELTKHLLNGENSLQNYVRVYLGEQDIRELNGVDTHVTQGDVISIIPAIAGG